MQSQASPEHPIIDQPTRSTVANSSLSLGHAIGPVLASTAPSTANPDQHSQAMWDQPRQYSYNESRPNPPLEECVLPRQRHYMVSRHPRHQPHTPTTRSSRLFPRLCPQSRDQY